MHQTLRWKKDQINNVYKDYCKSFLYNVKKNNFLESKHDTKASLILKFDNYNLKIIVLKCFTNINYLVWKLN